MKHITYILFLTLLFSCKKEIEFKIPNEERILVVNSNLCADSFISVKLTYTQSINDNSKPITENNAIVELFSKDTTLLETLNPTINGFYQTTFVKAEASKCYILKISTTQKVYWMQDSCPLKCSAALVKTDSIFFQGKSNFFRIKYQLTDLQLCSNYYGLKLKHSYETYLVNGGGATDTALVEEWIDVETIDPLLIQDENNKFSKKHILFSDLYFNNSTIYFSFGTSAISNTATKKTKKLSIELEQYSYDSYLYYASLIEHMFYQNDPFSQPTLVKGNISNALGSFIGKDINRTIILFKY